MAKQESFVISREFALDLLAVLDGLTEFGMDHIGAASERQRETISSGHDVINDLVELLFGSYRDALDDPDANL